jgi:iron complex transport system ATP-binding protein
MPSPERVTLRAEGLSFSYGGAAVLSGANLEARPGEVLALLGPNGAGKSTLLRLLAGLLEPSSGRVLLGDRELRALDRRTIAQHIALVPQEPPQDAGFTALEVVLLGRAPHLGAWGVEGEADRERARAALAELDVSALADRPMAALSGGERRRVLLARARCQGAPVVLLDEPTAHLDLGQQAHALARARAWAAEGAAVVAVLHDPNLARTSANAVALVSAGGAVESGPVALLTAEKLSALYGWPIEEAPLFRAAQPAP